MDSGASPKCYYWVVDPVRTPDRNLGRRTPVGTLTVEMNVGVRLNSVSIFLLLALAAGSNSYLRETGKWSRGPAVRPPQNQDQPGQQRPTARRIVNCNQYHFGNFSTHVPVENTRRNDVMRKSRCGRARRQVLGPGWSLVEMSPYCATRPVR